MMRRKVVSQHAQAAAFRSVRACCEGVLCGVDDELGAAARFEQQLRELLLTDVRFDESVSDGVAFSAD